VFQTRVLNQVAYTLGNKVSLTILPRNGNIISEDETVVISHDSKVSEIIKALEISKSGKVKDTSAMYFRPEMSIVDVRILHDQSKAHFFKKATIVIADKSKLLFSFLLSVSS